MIFSLEIKTAAGWRWFQPRSQPDHHQRPCWDHPLYPQFYKTTAERCRGNSIHECTGFELLCHGIRERLKLCSKEITLAFYSYLAALPCTNPRQNAVSNSTTNFTAHKTGHHNTTRNRLLLPRVAFGLRNRKLLFSALQAFGPTSLRLKQDTIGPESEGWRRNLCSPKEESSHRTDLPCASSSSSPLSISQQLAFRAPAPCHSRIIDLPSKVVWK